MAGENLQAFENLRETTANSLNDQEKKALNQIDAKDFRQSKDKIGQKKFTIDGNPMALKDIVKNLKFDSTGQRATLNGKQLAWKSELGAAIQVYAIANNKDVGFAGIDGKVGRGTIDGLQSTQNSVKIEEATKAKKQKEKAPENDKLSSRLSELVNFDYRGRVGEYKDKKYNLLVTIPGDKEGALKIAQREGNTEKISITYKSAINGKFHKININAGNCKENPKGSDYSANKFGKAIEKAIAKKEAELQIDATQESIVDAVESFDIRKLSLKSQAYLKEKNFMLNNKLDLKDGLFSGTGIAFDAKGNLHFGSAFIMPKEDIDSTYVGGKFNQDKFKSLLNPLLEKKATEYFTAKANKAAKGLGTITTSTLEAEDNKVRKADSEIKMIEKLGIPVSPENKKTIETKKNQIQIMKDFKNVSTEMEGKMSKLTKNVLLRKDMPSTNELITFLNSLKEHKAVSKGGKNVYSVYSKITNGDKKYNELMEKGRAVAIKYKPVELK